MQIKFIFLAKNWLHKEKMYYLLNLKQESRTMKHFFSKRWMVLIHVHVWYVDKIK